jgi:glycosidase
MNYPVRTALIAFVRDGDARTLANTLTELYAAYPRCVCHCLMNLLGTHDTQRILNVLGEDDEGERTNAELSTARMTAAQRELGLRRLRMASALQYTVYGIPSLFYGDEAGMEGHRDPFCRKPYPWGREDEGLLAHYRLLGEMRLKHPALDGGRFRVLTVSDHFLAYERERNGDRLVIAANRGTSETVIHLPGRWRDLLTGERYGGDIAVPPDTVLILNRGDR